MRNLILILAALVTFVACDGKNTLTGPSGNPPSENPPNETPNQPATPSIGTPYPRRPIGGDPSNSNPPALVVGRVIRTNLTNVSYDFDLWEEAEPGKPHIMASNVPENGDETSFQLPSALRHSTRYVWKVRARGTAPDGSIVTSGESNIQVFMTPKGVCNSRGNLGQGIPNEFEVRKTVKDLMMIDDNTAKEFVKDCRPQAPSLYLNEVMIRVVSELQKDDACWGYMKKDPANPNIRTPYKAIPRDILGYAWNGGPEGTTNFFVIDFINAGCDNNPNSDEYLDRAEGAKFVWSLLNRETGTVGNGVWSSTPDNF